MTTNYVVVGQMGSGKDEIGNYLKEHYGYTISKLGSPIRQDCDDMIQLMNLPGEPREYYQAYGQGMRNIFSPFIWSELLNERMKLSDGPFVIADCRQKEEVNYWMEKGFIPIGLYANEALRRQRLIDRDQSDQSRQFGHETEVSAGKIIEGIRTGEIPGHYLTNEGTLEDFHSAIEGIIKKEAVAV